jgi:hypothetical protein
LESDKKYELVSSVSVDVPKSAIPEDKIKLIISEKYTPKIIEYS